MTEPVLAVDLGGTNMRVAVVDPAGQVLLKRMQSTPREASTPAALEALLDAVRDEGGGRGSYSSVVVGVPGRVDYERGDLEYAPNLPTQWASDIDEQFLSRHFDARVSLANDADLAAVGEAYFGAGRGFGDVVYLTVSTGIGAGVVLNGHLVHGHRSLAEVGHTIIALDRLAAVDGRDGVALATAEQLGAGPALARYARAEGLDVAGAALVAEVGRGNRDARRAWDRLVHVVGVVVVNLTHLFSPDAVVIGGGVGRNGELLLKPVRTMVDRYGPRHPTTPLTIVEGALGDGAALVGAAAWRTAFYHEGDYSPSRVRHENAAE